MAKPRAGADEPPGLDRALALHVDEPDRLGHEVVAQELPRRARDLDLVGGPVRLHPARHVHRVAPQVVEETAASDHSGHDRPRADADAQAQVVLGALGKTALRAPAHLERQPGQRVRMIGSLPGDARRDHVAVADRLDLLDLVAVDELVEAREEPVEDADDLARIESGRQWGEADDVGEQDAHLVEVVRDRVGIRLEALRDLGREDVEQERLDARLRDVPSLRKRHEQHHRDERDDQDVEDVEGADEAVRKVGAVRPDHFGEDKGEQHRGDECRKPRPGTAGAAEGDCPERREQRPQDHRARLLEATDHDHSQRRRDENQKQLRGPQELEAPGPREDAEADRRSGGVRPRRERDRVLTDEPVQAAPDDRDREDGERDADEKPFPEAFVGRVARIRSDGERVIDQRHGHDDERRRSPRLRRTHGVRRIPE